MSDSENPVAPPPPPPDDPPTPAEPPAAGSPPSEQGGGGASENRTLMVVLSYLWILALIPLLVEKDDKEVQWHAKNGLVLTAAEFVFWLAVGVLSMASAFVGCLLMPIYVVGWLVILGVHILCMVKGVKGERQIIPGLSQYADRF